MSFEKQSEELNDIEKQQKKENIITGKELKGEDIVGIGTVDLDIYKGYFKDKGVKCKIYTYKNSPELSLLVLGSSSLLSSKQIFDELIKGNEKIEGAFWPNSTVKEETELELVYENN